MNVDATLLETLRCSNVLASIGSHVNSGPPTPTAVLSERGDSICSAAAVKHPDASSRQCPLTVVHPTCAEAR